MVFCGKPSKGCSHCRARRIKCDQLQPACSQCLRVSKVCTGYRDQLELSFRDENEKVLRKVRLPKQSQNAEPKTRKEKVPIAREISAVPAMDPVQVQEGPCVLEMALMSFQEPVQMPSVDEGIKFFFTHYVPAARPLTPVPGTPLMPFLSTNKAYVNAVSSVGFAGLSNVTKDPAHMLTARRKHAYALQELGKSLKNPSETDLNGTFISILLLAFFELVNDTNGATQGDAWGFHLDGGAAILKLISASPDSRLPWAARMEIQFVFSVFIKALTKNQPPPPSITEWAATFIPSMSSTDAHTAVLCDLVARLVALKATMPLPSPIRSHFNLILDAAYIYNAALELDNELAVWDAQLPAEWRFEIQSLGEYDVDELFMYKRRLVFGENMHVWSDLWTSRVYNHYRWARIIVNELLLQFMPSTSTDPNSIHASQTRHSLSIINLLSTEICASVSAQFYIPTLNAARSIKFPPMSGSFVLLYPLLIAGSAVGVGVENYGFAKRTLELFGNEMGICQALALVREMRGRRRAWMSAAGEEGEELVGEDLDSR